MRPSDIIIKRFSDLANSEQAMCVGVRPRKAYHDGIAGEIIGFTYDIVLPSRKYERISLIIEGDAIIDPELFKMENISVPIENIKNFEGRWYKNQQMADYGLSCKATGFVICKEVKL